LIAWDDSLIYILSLKDKLQMHREIDNLDILSTIHVDTDIEKEQNETSVQASLLLIQGLRHNGDINKSVEDKVNSSMQSRLKELDIKLEAEYRKDLEAVYMDIEAKNREKKRFLDLIDHEQQTEENELTYKLALEQNTEAEKLRKEYAMQKRTGIKEIQQHFISDAVEMGSLNVEKSEWLMKQHKELQEEIHKKYDNEISLQRMVLEEKLTRRRALALKSESQEDDSTETLNNIASVQLTLLAKLRKVSEDQADEYINQVQSDLINVKDKMNEDKESKQLELAKKLSQAKQKALAEKMNQHASELNKFVSSNKALQSDGPVDPLSYVDGLVSLKSHQRIELCALENELDESHAHELESVRQQGVQKAKDELETLERALIEKVKTEGLSDHVVDKILADHKKMMNEMAERQLVRRQNQDARLKDELARRKREWENRRIIEKKEQQGLREHEGEVVDKLLSSQVALSEQERDRILREHEKQMVMFENSLTLNKLRQKQMLEEKISQRRARQREDLQQKQNAELLKQRKYAENNGEEDDEHTYKKEILLLKKHAEQRITAMQAVDFDMEAQLEEVRVEMAKERALILKDKEERLGALIASLQMDKAREMARIEEQQKAINSLKANLMDDLNARGILSTPECEKILSIHKEEQEHLSHKLDGQRIKQEKMLHQKLQERLSQREKIMMQQQENEMRMLMNSAGNKTNANIRRAILLNKQMVQMEQFRNKMEKEISQSLANTKNNFEIQKQQIFQDQEMKFLAGLVKIGQLSRNELVDVLHMLFPGKTEESILEILSRIYPDETPLTRWEDKTKNPSDHKMERRQSTLANRIYTDQYSNPTPLHRRGSVMTMFPPKGSNTDKKLKKKGSQLQMTSNSNYSLGYDTTGPSENPQISPLTNYEQINGGSYNYLQTRNIPTQNSLRRQSRTSGLGNENFSKQRLEDNEYLLGKKKQLPPNDSAYKNYTERRFDHSGEGDEDSDDNGYRQYRRDSQLKYGTKTSTKLDERHKGPRRQGRINHNGEDEEEEENGSDEDYYTEKDETEQRYTSRRLPPLRNQSEPSAKKKKSKLLKKLAHHDDYDY
ncbi:limbin, partial [Plakobranchus ocellatus]